MRYPDYWLERQNWHRWFAWRSVLIGRERVWLETVERRRVTGNTTVYGRGASSWWEYRTIE